MHCCLPAPTLRSKRNEDAEHLPVSRSGHPRFNHHHAPLFSRCRLLPFSRRGHAVPPVRCSAANPFVSRPHALSIGELA